MSVIRFSTFLAAPAKRCFDLARSIDAHVTSQVSYGERAVAGVTTGLIGLGEELSRASTTITFSTLRTAVPR